MEVLLTTIGIITILKLFKKENFEETYYDSESYYKTHVPKKTQKKLGMFTIILFISNTLYFLQTRNS